MSDEVRVYNNVYLLGLKEPAKALKGFELETFAILCHFVSFPYPFLPVSLPFFPHPPFVFLFLIIIIIIIIIIISTNNVSSRSRWPHGLRRGSTAARLLGLRVRIPPGECMSVCLVSVVCCQIEVSASG